MPPQPAAAVVLYLAYWCIMAPRSAPPQPVLYHGTTHCLQPPFFHCFIPPSLPHLAQFSLDQRQDDLRRLRTAGFVTEFGGVSDVKTGLAEVRRVTEGLDAMRPPVSWAFWAGVPSEADYQKVSCFWYVYSVLVLRLRTRAARSVQFRAAPPSMGC